MKSICTTNHEVYCKLPSGKLSILKIEVEEYKTVYHAHIVDHSKYYPLLHTVRFSKQKTKSLSDIVHFMYLVAQRYNYFH